MYFSIYSHILGKIKDEWSENLGLNTNQPFLVVQSWASYLIPEASQRKD